MSNLAGIDLTQVEESDSFDAIPAGWYPAFISDSDKKLSASGNEYLKLEFTIQAAPYENRKVFANLNLWHHKAQVANIAQRDLKAISTAVNVQPQDSQQLHNRPMQIKLGIRKTEEYGDQNEIKGYKALSGAAPTGVTPAVAAVGNAAVVPAAQETAAAPTKKPWE